MSAFDCKNVKLAVGEPVPVHTATQASQPSQHHEKQPLTTAEAKDRGIMTVEKWKTVAEQIQPEKMRFILSVVQALDKEDWTKVYIQRQAEMTLSGEPVRFMRQPLTPDHKVRLQRLFVCLFGLFLIRTICTICTICLCVCLFGVWCSRIRIL